MADYYKTINHQVLINQLKQHITDPTVLNLVWQYCDRLELVNAEPILVTQGLPKGGSLSPLLGNLYLRPLDIAMNNDKTLDKSNKSGSSEQSTTPNIKYIRYMDDILIFVKNKFSLRRVLKKLYTVLDSLKLTLAKDKTYIGRVSKGFSFLGYQFSGIKNQPLGISKTTVLRMQEKLRVLYEQRASKERVAEYLLRWVRWVRGGLRGIRVDSCVALLLICNYPELTCALA